LKDVKKFLQPGSDGSGNGGSFKQLVSQIVGAVTTDLLNALNKVKGFGQTQNKQSGATSDLTSDKGKQGAGSAQIDDTLKKALKDILKPHD